MASPTGKAATKEQNLIAPPAAGSEESYAKSVVDADKTTQQRHASAAASASASATASPAAANNAANTNNGAANGTAQNGQATR